MRIATSRIGSSFAPYVSACIGSFLCRKDREAIGSAATAVYRSPALRGILYFACFYFVATVGVALLTLASPLALAIVVASPLASRLFRKGKASAARLDRICLAARSAPPATLPLTPPVYDYCLAPAAQAELAATAPSAFLLPDADESTPDEESIASADDSPAPTVRIEVADLLTDAFSNVASKDDCEIVEESINEVSNNDVHTFSPATVGESFPLIGVPCPGSYEVLPMLPHDPCPTSIPATSYPADELIGYLVNGYFVCITCSHRDARDCPVYRCNVAPYSQQCSSCGRLAVDGARSVDGSPFSLFDVAPPYALGHNLPADADVPPADLLDAQIEAERAERKAYGRAAEHCSREESMRKDIEFFESQEQPADPTYAEYVADCEAAECNASANLAASLANYTVAELKTYAKERAIPLPRNVRTKAAIVAYLASK
jgi:hypothetical protein